MGRSDDRALAVFDVVLEREALAPGDTITGVVLLQAQRPVADAVLTVDLRGRECIEAIDHVDNETHTSDHSIWFCAIDRRRLHLSTMDGLDIPFSVELPTALPPTTQLNFGSRRRTETNLRIEYEVVCTLHIPTDERADVNHCAPFTVAPLPLARRVGEPVEKSIRRSFHHGYLLKKSSCRVHVHLDSDVFMLDSQITAHVEIELQDRERLQSLSITLWRRMLPSVSHPLLAHDSKKVTSTSRNHAQLVGDSMTSLSLIVPPSMLSEVGPLKPTIRFHHFIVVYEVVITCEVKSCSPIAIPIPVTILPLAPTVLSSHP